MRTTLPRRLAAVRGSVLSHSVARPREDNSPSTGDPAAAEVSCCTTKENRLPATAKVAIPTAAVLKSRRRPRLTASEPRCVPIVISLGEHLTVLQIEL